MTQFEPSLHHISQYQPYEISQAAKKASTVDV